MGVGKEMKGGGEVLGNNPRRNICQTGTHTHFKTVVGARGPVAELQALNVDCRRLLPLEEEEPSKSGRC